MNVLSRDINGTLWNVCLHTNKSSKNGRRLTHEVMEMEHKPKLKPENYITKVQTQTPDTTGTLEGVEACVGVGVSTPAVMSSAGIFMSR